ncbi:D-Ala-D-Ala carboxypeptidase family metallohydrolase [Candidatus Magnetominusculus xianensis]|uniref:Peptidase M15 n=1 Tax=Candidatus Magnetominusculus xianensis TaxID=1748249 RepID=A0ABR5SHY5_9BACT|nr:D-Ala-D-Ala carboxypeptidase family metallohydrolase [Candidatus Magnetominusculus xianensis]KWT91837.1 peptidase M15 [Candidatus Magnetominusculus xianensis]MBF0403892.1 peptidase M15 [Nitrospirota bacterium]
MERQTPSATGQTEDFTCRCGCGLNNISAALVATLDKIRESAGIALKITSGCRCKTHNKAIGGKSDSAHLKGLATDISIASSHERYLVSKAAIDAGVERLGIGTTLVHLDIDKDKPQKVAWLYA